MKSPRRQLPNSGLGDANRSPLPRTRKFPKPELIRRTMDEWQPHYAHRLTQEDAREIVDNAVGFFRILREWKIAEQKAQAGHSKHN